MALIPSTGAVYLAMRNPRFVKATNWQSRTALAIMPALFMYGYAAESKLIHRMEEVAEETQHTEASVKWAEKHQQLAKENTTLAAEAEHELTSLYKKSVAESGVRIVPGDRLSFHHQIANYWQENPFKILAIAGIPAVGYIFWGRAGKDHLQLQMKVMHTRVMGQFTVISLLLGLMGFKEYMDRNGKFITESEANARVAEMHAVRQNLINRLAQEKAHKHELEEELHKAHEKDVAEGHVHVHKKKNKHVEEAPRMDQLDKMTAVSPK
jgi:hypothetical protein